MGVVVFTKVLGHAKSQMDFQTLLVLGPLQKLLLPFIFHGSVPLSWIGNVEKNIDLPHIYLAVLYVITKTCDM